VTRGDTETDASAALAVENAADALLQMKYSDWHTVGIERSREMPSNHSISTATAPSCNVAETQAGSNTGSDTEESDGGASVETICGPEPAEVMEASLRSKSEGYVLESLGRSFKLTR
jgi:hypothetical protein